MSESIYAAALRLADEQRKDVTDFQDYTLPDASVELLLREVVSREEPLDKKIDRLLRS